MLVSQPEPHTAQVKVRLLYEGLTGLVEGLGPVDGKSPVKLIVVYKDVWTGLAE